MRNLTVQIPRPCHEQWDTMQPTEKGWFCASCQKTVVDYTALSDRELIRRLSQASGDICGRLRDDQLNRPLILLNQETTRWQQWLGVLTMGLLSWQTAQAQSKQTEPQTASVRPDWLIKPLASRAASAPDTTWTVTGRAMLEDSSGMLSPMSQADVFIRAGAGWITKTDSTGTFSLLIPTHLQITQIQIIISAPDRLRGGTTVTVSSANPIVNVGDVVVYQTKHIKDVIGGGLAVIQTPSRWQRIKRKLFQKTH